MAISSADLGACWWSWKTTSYAGLGWVFGPWELGSSAGTAGWQQITQRLRPHKLLEVPAWAPTGSVAVEEVCAMELEHRSGQVTIAHPFRLGSVSVSQNWEAGASFCFISSRCCSTYGSFKLVKKIGGFSVKKKNTILFVFEIDVFLWGRMYLLCMLWWIRWDYIWVEQWNLWDSAFWILFWWQPGTRWSTEPCCMRAAAWRGSAQLRVTQTRWPAVGMAWCCWGVNEQQKKSVLGIFLPFWS